MACIPGTKHNHASCVSNQTSSSRRPVTSPFYFFPSSTLAFEHPKSLPSILLLSGTTLVGQKLRTKRALMVSSVAQGKKPARSATTTPTPSRKTTASHPPANAAATKPTSGRTEHQPTRQLQKRVLPSRSRRGGPGLGSADVDAIILDAQKRKCGLLSFKNTYIQSVPPFRSKLGRNVRSPSPRRPHAFCARCRVWCIPPSAALITSRD